MKLLHRLRLDTPWDWGGLACVFLAVGFALMTEISWWRWLEYAAAFCGLMAVVVEHETHA